MSFQEKLGGKGKEEVLGVSVTECESVCVCVWGAISEDKLQFVLVVCLRSCANLFFKSKENRKQLKESEGYRSHPVGLHTLTETHSRKEDTLATQHSLTNHFTHRIWHQSGSDLDR